MVPLLACADHMKSVDAPDPNWKHIPLAATGFESEEMYNAVVEAMQRTSFWPAVSMLLPSFCDI